MDYGTMFFFPLRLALVHSHSSDVVGLSYNTATTFLQREKTLRPWWKHNRSRDKVEEHVIFVHFRETSKLFVTKSTKRKSCGVVSYFYPCCKAATLNRCFLSGSKVSEKREEEKAKKCLHAIWMLNDDNPQSVAHFLGSVKLRFLL